MCNHLLSKKLIQFEEQLQLDEKSILTIRKYVHDVRCFLLFTGARSVDKSLLLEYKTDLKKRYSIASANSMIVALNAFLRFCGWHNLCLKQFRVQRQVFCSEEKELTKAEYFSLVRSAEKKNNERLSLIIQTICSTGIRISELCHITVEAAKKGEATVSCKNKTRMIFIVSQLRKKLLKYAKEQGIASGEIFVTKTGKPINRSNVWSDMKKLCIDAGVNSDKVFPHNLRHLFARTFYGIEKDIVKLADILGHSSINTTRIYIITSGAEHKRRMENLRLII